MLSLIAWIGVFNSLVSAGACGVVIYAVYYFTLCEGVKIAIGLCVGYYLLSITAGLLLLKGLYDRQPLFVVPVLCLQFFETLVHLGGYIFGIFVFIAKDLAMWLFLFCPVGIALIGLFVYYWINLYKYYINERASKRKNVTNYDKFE